MLYILAAVLALTILVLRATAPKRYSVHASRAVALPDGIRADSRYAFGGFLRGEDGNRIDLTDKFVGQAVRDSMTAFGIPDGATFIADYVDTDARCHLLAGDIVV